MTLVWHQDVVDRMLRGAGGDVDKDLERRSRAVQSAARASAPRRTGALANSFQTERDPTSREARWTVYSSSDYLAAVEAGRGPVTPVTARVLVWNDGGTVFARRAGAVAGRSFFENSVEAAAH